MNMIYGTELNPNELSVEALCELNEAGLEFVVEGGEITDVLHRQSDC